MKYELGDLLNLYCKSKDKSSYKYVDYRLRLYNNN